LWENKQNSHFLQSFDWGEFQRHFGKEILRIQIKEGNQVVGQVQGVVHAFPLGIKYLYIPRSEISTSEEYSCLLDFLKKQFSFVFVRFEPVSLQSSIIKDLQIVPTHPRLWQHTLVLNLEDSLETLLAQMHSKTRYNIRLAERKGVVIEEIEDIDIFWKLNEETSLRDKIKTHDKAYYKEMIKGKQMRLLCGFVEGNPVCAGIFSFYNKRCTYLHGASGNAYRNVMAPYLLQWHAIKMAQDLGCEEYDFGGIAAPAQKDKPSTEFHNLCWSVEDKLTGVTRFKAGFGGGRESYGDSFDIILNLTLYKLYTFLRRLIV